MGIEILGSLQVQVRCAQCLTANLNQLGACWCRRTPSSPTRNKGGTPTKAQLERAGEKTLRRAENFADVIARLLRSSQ